ncbi:MAG: hypothetical protein WCO04_03055 [Pseudomonadota bacterium]
MLDHQFCLFKTSGLAQGPLPLSIVQTEDSLTVAGRDMASLTRFSLSVGMETILEVVARFLPLKQRVNRLILRMPSQEFRTYVYLDWDVLLSDRSRVDLAVKVESCIFLPRLSPHLFTQGQMSKASEPVFAVPQSVILAPKPSILAAEPVLPSPHAIQASVVADEVVGLVPRDPPVIRPKADGGRRRLTMILPVSDDLRTSFLGFGYSVGAGVAQPRALEIGAFRRNLRSSYSRLMGDTEVIDLKAQPPAPNVVSELEATLRRRIDDLGALTCFIGSEVLSAEVLEIFRRFAQETDLAITAVICSATPASSDIMSLIEVGLAGPELQVQQICFQPIGEPAGPKDAMGMPRGYFGVPMVEGQSMARCMEFRSNVEDPVFIVPASVPPRESHALERFISAFRPLSLDAQHQPAA